MARKTQTQETAVSCGTLRERTRRAIVQLLKQEGRLDAETLASHLKITAMVVRQHLYALQDEQLVTNQEESCPMGRPAKLWQLTTTADRFFPDEYAELTLSLLNSVKQAFSEAGLDRLLEVRSQQQLESYNQQMKGKRSLKQRLNKLVEIRTHEGYTAEVQTQADESFLLIENHCPICATATACTGLCAKEIEIFQAILGDAMHIQRVEHIISGERRYAY